MPKRILIPIDGSLQSARAVEFAVDEWPDAELTLLHVIDPAGAGYGPGTGVPSGAEEWFENAKTDAEELLSEATPRDTVEASTMTEVGRPAQTIVEVADEAGFDHVVMGSHGRTGVSRILLGSVAEDVVRSSTVPVTVVR
ncbi:Nucleotide-binding universal stress protein, UspA family [Halogranum amylolyticum]|uniref:Nucleotide-binding universal stress protein, UspA family n=1 Tax=Halogranum amylolyticum TaxID=660520 RepID=A0A1H8NG69_9EURY|nr:universal stress protein [Halogranum amylolyticum]SEO28605.1 Nucleotide-binding universal stress protein, UspA family [Halogranum amylolyticum]